MNIWEEIKSKVDIVDVISEYIPVQPAGSNYRALSPFKKEKTPSLMISPSKQIWHDFSTGKGGDVFGFVMQMENSTRAEALKKLAEKAGVQLKHNYKADSPITEEQKTLQQIGYQALDWSAQLYHSILKKILVDRSHPVTRYCLERRLTPQLIEQFQIGYAPSNNFLLRILEEKKHDKNIFEHLELLVNRNGRLKDKFSDRLMIPIRNLDGKTVGFTGRTLPHDKNPDRPKYLNSSQSEWFDKSKIWFGLDKARKQITLEKKAIVVEGNMDVIAAFGAGLEYTIASQGTSFTLEQLKILARFTKQVLLAFDNDSAGIAAAEKFFMVATPLGFTVQRIIIPERYKDLDEMLGATAGTAQSIASEPFLDTWVDRNTTRLTSSKTDEQKQAIQDVCTLLSAVDEITLEQYVKRLHGITGISTATLTKLALLQKEKNPKISNQDDFTLGASLIHRGIAQSATSVLKENMTIAWQKIAAVYMQNPTAIPADLLASLYSTLRIFEVFPEANWEEYMQNCSQELAFIAEEGHITFDTQTILQHLTGLEKLIDSRLSTFLADKTSLENYYRTKQLIEQFKRTL